uniref:Uncharacterized protein n=1 Tax=Nelumbo nucifera TaxID=4432 RepID=A0A822XKQ2_NELNU|nr:TPA_asm: hypothetical protein HUJ06_020989 [Nelumbo nucifera]
MLKSVALSDLTETCSYTLRKEGETTGTYSNPSSKRRGKSRLKSSKRSV